MATVQTFVLEATLTPFNARPGIYFSSIFKLLKYVSPDILMWNVK
jgi:hypothetical protein